MADVNTKVPYLRRVSTLPEVSSKQSINLTDTLILVQSNTTKTTTVQNLIGRMLDLAEIPSAYDIAVKHGFIGTEDEWLESLKNNGVNFDEMCCIVGKYFIADGHMALDANTGKPATFERSTTDLIDGDAFVIYRDTTTNKVYTKHPSTGLYTEWAGVLDLATFVNEIISDDHLEIYTANQASTVPFNTIRDETGTYDVLTGITDRAGSYHPYQNYNASTGQLVKDHNPKLGALIRLIYTDEPYGILKYYDGYRFQNYTGIVDYVRFLTSNLEEIAAGTAKALKVPRDIGIKSNISGDTTTDITAASFDGTEDVNIIIKKLNAGVLTGTAPINITGTATSLAATSAKNIDGIKFDGTVDISRTPAMVTTGAGSGTQNWAVTINNFQLVDGAEVNLCFSSEVRSGDTLNINGTGAKPIYYKGSAVPTGAILTYDYHTFVYKDGKYHVVGDLMGYHTIDGISTGGTNHSSIYHTDITRYQTCSTAAATAAKTITVAGYKLVTGAQVVVKFTVTNTANNPTINVSGTGAKPIYFRGAAVTPYYLAADTIYTMVYDGTSYNILSDADNIYYSTWGVTSTSITIKGFVKAPGTTIYLRISAASTNATNVTLNITQTGAHNIIKGYDSNGNQQIAQQKDFELGRVYQIIFDGTNYILTNFRVNNAQTADKLSNSFAIKITGGATSDTKNVDGTEEIALNVTQIDASKIVGTLSDQVQLGNVTVDKASQVSVRQNTTSKMYFTGVTSLPSASSASGETRALYTDPNISTDGSGNVVVKSMRAVASDATAPGTGGYSNATFYMRNIGYGKTEIPSTYTGNLNTVSGNVYGGPGSIYIYYT